MLGALGSRSALSVLVGALFKKFGLFLNTPRNSTLPLISALNGGWVVNATLWPRYPRKDCIGGWVGPRGRSGRVWKISPPSGVQSMDRPACSELLYRLGYPGPQSLTLRPVTHTYFWTLFVISIYYQWRTREFFSGCGVGSTNSVEDRGQRERGSGGGSP
jgi:hypothetical protein